MIPKSCLLNHIITSNIQKQAILVAKIRLQAEILHLSKITGRNVESKKILRAEIYLIYYFY